MLTAHENESDDRSAVASATPPPLLSLPPRRGKRGYINLEPRKLCIRSALHAKLSIMYLHKRDWPGHSPASLIVGKR